MEKKLALPRAVREQAERAEAAHLELIGNTAPAAPVTQVEAPPVEVVAPQTTPEAPVLQVAAPVETQPVAQHADQWELKYRVLNGKYQAEVPAMAAEIRSLKEQLRTQSSAPPAQPAAVDADDDTTVTPTRKVAEQYGDDFAAAVSAIADERTSKLRDEFKSKVDVIEVDTAERRRGDFMAELARLVPNWAQIDSDSGFTAYLNDIDPQTGRMRREFFTEADQSNNAARVASFFTAFSGGNKTTAPAPAAEPAPSVEHLLSPDSSRSSEAPPGKKLWSRAEVQRFYADARGVSGRPYGRFTAAEYERIDSDISAASAEGRYLG